MFGVVCIVIFIFSMWSSCVWVGELADGFGLWSEETPLTMLNCNVCKGVGRELWLQSRNGTSNCGLTVMHPVGVEDMVGCVETAVLQGERANRRL